MDLEYSQQINIFDATSPHQFVGRLSDSLWPVSYILSVVLGHRISLKSINRGSLPK